MTATDPLHDPTHWSTVRALFDDAVGLPPDAREAFLDRRCRHADGQPDEALRRAVATLLQADTDADDDFLAQSPTHRLVQDGATGQRVGPYRLDRLLGRGGMGEVFLAERDDGLFHRSVALKRIRPGLDVPTITRRFEAERRTLARLQHAGIARLLDAGSDDGRAWLAMDYIDGEPLTDFAARTDLGLDDRLALFVQVCDAVHHAHQRLVVHRDLKPSNILVTQDGDGEPRAVLLDFGIARLLEDDAEGLTLTGAEASPMTRAYAAPEQLRGEDATTSTDVYALGVLLFELLTGCRPFNAPTPAQLELAILEGNAPRASTVSQAIPSSRLRGDLDTIIGKALATAPEARYASAEALADDVRRSQDGLPITARPPTPLYRLRRFAQRHPAGLAASGLLLAILVGGSALYTIRVTVERNTAEATTAFLEGLFAAADPLAEERLDTLRVRDVLDRGLAQAQTELADQPLVRARLLSVIGTTYIGLSAPDRAEEPLLDAVRLLREQDDPGRLSQSLSGLSRVHHSQQRHEEAEATAREALDLAQSVGTPQLRAVAERRLIAALIAQGQLDEAIPLAREHGAWCRDVFGPDDAETLQADVQLARALTDEGNLREAEQVWLSLRDRFVERFGPDAPYLVDTYGALSFLYLAQGRLDQATEMGAQSLRVARPSIEGTGKLGQILSIYAMALRRQGRLVEAAALLEEALALPALRPGAHAIPLGSLASVRAAQGDFETAAALQRQSMELLQHTDGASRLFSQVKLAGFLRDDGRFAEAEAELLAAYADTGPEPGSHQAGGRIVDELVALYEAWDREDEAARWRSRQDG